MYTGDKEEVMRQEQGEVKKEHIEPVIKKPISVAVDKYDIKSEIARVQKTRKESVPVFEGLPSFQSNLSTASNNYEKVDAGNRTGVGVSRAYSVYSNYSNESNTAVLDKEEIELKQAKKMVRRRSAEEVLQEIEARKKKANLSSVNNKSNRFKEYTERDFLKHSTEKGEVYKGHTMYNHPVYNFLVDRDFDPVFVQEVVDGYGVEEDFLDNREDYGCLARVIATQFNYAEQMSVAKNKQNFVYFVGPTGVGKTTTLAKIAASFFKDKDTKKTVVDPKLKIASFDIIRMMAMEQMRAFAKIIKVPFRKLFSKEDLITLIREVNKGELVLVDTSGISIKEQEDINEISSFINLNSNVGGEIESKPTDFKLTKGEINSYSSQAYLCLNVGYRYNDLKKIFKAFLPTGFNRVILTKQDESYSLGSVLSLLSEHDCEIAYLTDGQDVPNDLQVATAELLEEKLIEEWSF